MSSTAIILIILYLLVFVFIGWKVGKITGKAQGPSLRRIGQLLVLVFGLSAALNLIAAMLIFHFGFGGVGTGAAQVGGRGIADVVFGWSITTSIISAIVAFPTFQWFNGRKLSEFWK